MRTVLLADDNRECRDSLARMLKRWGCRFLPAVDVAEALWLLEKTLVNLAILDLEMPLGGGLSVLHRIRVSQPGLPVLMLTGSATRESLLRAYAAGAYGFLPKPVSVDLLRQMLAEVLTTHMPALVRMGSVTSRGPGDEVTPPAILK
jgi:two-component system response regulator PilR (NtrC family)